MRRLVISAALLLVVAAGCSSDSSTGVISTGEAPPAPAEPTTEPTPEPAAEPTAEATAEPTPEPTPQPSPETSGAPTIDELLASPGPLNIAHAGGDQEAPHSTMFAFDSAVAAGADVLELDVQLSGDGVLIVQHDDTVGKTTNETGPVADRSFDELAALDAGYWFSPECWPCQDRPVEEYVYRGVRTGEVDPPAGATPEDFRIITFRELAEAYPDLPFDIEIKGSYPDAVPVAEALAAELRELGRTDSAVVVSFDDELLAAFEEIAPEVETSPGVDEMTAWILGGQPLTGHRIVQVPPEFDGVTVLSPAFWELVERDGVVVWVWPNDAATQENAAFYGDLVAQGAHGVIAGRPVEMAGIG
ncbi:MAG: hypothetical protein KDB21_15015 [Acidimicrobiales bacterium]|nr:hypothetical protein [Acidimicrobiales bacterium]